MSMFKKIKEENVHTRERKPRNECKGNVLSSQNTFTNLR